MFIRAAAGAGTGGEGACALAAWAVICWRPRQWREAKLCNGAVSACTRERPDAAQGRLQCAYYRSAMLGVTSRPHKRGRRFGCVEWAQLGQGGVRGCELLLVVYALRDARGSYVTVLGRYTGGWMEPAVGPRAARGWLAGRGEAD
jgi:hypothetical protein